MDEGWRAILPEEKHLEVRGVGVGGGGGPGQLQCSEDGSFKLNFSHLQTIEQLIV